MLCDGQIDCLVHLHQTELNRVAPVSTPFRTRFIKLFPTCRHATREQPDANISPQSYFVYLNKSIARYSVAQRNEARRGEAGEREGYGAKGGGNVLFRLIGIRAGAGGSGSSLFHN